MALQGTLDTFALPDVLRLLASTKKSGRLLIRGNRGDGSLWFDDGAVVASAASGAGDAASDGEVVFELLRYGDGSFTFEAGSPPTDPHAPAEVEPLLVDAEHLLVEWRAIEAVVPSLDAWVGLTPTLPEDEVTIDAATWHHIGAVGGGSSVRELGAALGLRELDVCRTVRSLVEAGLAAVSEARPGAAPTPAPEPEPAPVAQEAPAPVEEPTGRPARLIDLETPADRASGYTRTLEVDESRAPAAAPAPDGFAIDIPGVAPIGTPEPVPAPSRPARTAAKPMSPNAPAAKLAPTPEHAPEAEPAEADEVARQLASLSPKAARAVAAAARAGTVEEREAALAEAIDDEDEPINRGLLLKFLSSVRS